MYYIQITSDNKMMTIKGWMTIEQKETKETALEAVKILEDAIAYTGSKTKVRAVSAKEWRKQIWGA